MQLANNLPLFIARYRSYDKPIRIISKWLIERNKRLNFVDVGANVGDTVVNVGIKEGNYLEIEGDERYLNLLAKNLEGYHYKLENCYLTDQLNLQQEVNVSYTSEHTLKNVSGNIQTLSDVLKNVGFEADIIKIDTDGYDLKVIRGGIDYIQERSPLLFVEWYPKWLIGNNQEDPLDLFRIMNGIGYRKCILFDNYGTINAVLDTDDMQNFRIFEKYSLNAEKQIYYWDICFIPPQINDINFLVEKLLKWEDYC